MLVFLSVNAQTFDHDGLSPLRPGYFNQLIPQSYFEYVCPGWEIPKKYENRVGGKIGKTEQAWFWNDKDCNIYSYWYVINLRTGRRLVSFLSTPLFTFKVFDDGSAEIRKGLSNVIYAQKNSENFPLIPDEQKPVPTHYCDSRQAIHPCEHPNYSCNYVTVSILENMRKMSKITSAAKFASGNCIAMGGIFKDDLYWEVIDSTGKVLGRQIFERSGIQSLSAILTLPNINGVSNDKNKPTINRKTITDKDRDADRFLPDANYLLAGTTEDPNIYPKLPKDFYATLCNKSGKVVWEKKYGGSGEDICTAAIATRDGKYFVLAGMSNSPMGRNISRAKVGNDNDFWCIKIDLQGNVIWDGRYGTNQGDTLTSIIETRDGNFLLGGYSTGLLDLGRNELGNNTSAYRPKHNYNVIKIDQAGNFVWGRLFGGDGNDKLFQIIPSSTIERYHLWGTSDSKELFPQGTRATTTFHSDLDTAYQRTTTYMWDVEIDKDGNNMGASFDNPRNLFGGLDIETTERNVFSYGYVYRVSDAHKFNKEYLYLNDLRKYVYGSYTSTINPGPFSDNYVVDVLYKTDVIQLAIHAEEENVDRYSTEPVNVATVGTVNTKPLIKITDINKISPYPTQKKVTGVNEQQQKVPDIKPAAKVPGKVIKVDKPDIDIKREKDIIIKNPDENTDRQYDGKEIKTIPRDAKKVKKSSKPGYFINEKDSSKSKLIENKKAPASNKGIQDPGNTQKLQKVDKPDVDIKKERDTVIVKPVYKKLTKLKPFMSQSKSKIVKSDSLPSGKGKAVSPK